MAIFVVNTSSEITIDTQVLLDVGRFDRGSSAAAIELRRSRDARSESVSESEWVNRAVLAELKRHEISIANAIRLAFETDLRSRSEYPTEEEDEGDEQAQVVAVEVKFGEGSILAEVAIWLAGPVGGWLMHRSAAAFAGAAVAPIVEKRIKEIYGVSSGVVAKTRQTIVRIMPYSISRVPNRRLQEIEDKLHELSEEAEKRRREAIEKRTGEMWKNAVIFLIGLCLANLGIAVVLARRVGLL